MCTVGLADSETAQVRFAMRTLTALQAHVSSGDACILSQRKHNCPPGSTIACPAALAPSWSASSTFAQHVETCMFEH